MIDRLARTVPSLTLSHGAAGNGLYEPRIKGDGPVGACQLLAAGEVAERRLVERPGRNQIVNCRRRSKLLLVRAGVLPLPWQLVIC